MKIIHTEASTGWGGQEIRILKEAAGMRDKGYDIVFITEHQAQLNQKAKELNFKTYNVSFKRKNWLFSFVKLQKILKKEKATIINTHSSLDAWLVGISAKILDIPVIRTRHLSAKVKKGLNSRIVYNYLADFVVTTCAKIIPTLAKQSNKPLQFFKSIPTGIDPREIEVDPKDVISFRQKHNIRPSDILIGMVCFMRSWKGIEDFFQTVNYLKSRKNLKWIIIGGGHIQTYRQKAKEYKVHDLIIFTDHLKDPYPAIASLDIFTLLSTANEGVSQASLQAAYLKKPLITTTTGGLCEVCLNNKTGFIVPLSNYHAVVRAILKLVDDPDLRNDMGKNANLLVLEKFSFESMLTEMHNVYQKVVDERNL